MSQMNANWDRRADRTRGDLPVLGVVVVTYDSSDVIVECLESLAASKDVSLKIVVVDNASGDDTCAVIKAWAAGEQPFERPTASPIPSREPVTKPIPIAELDEPLTPIDLGRLTLVHAATNRGFAGGVNLGLRALQGQVDWYWILNPDCAVLESTAAAYAEAAATSPGFGLMTGKTVYYHQPDLLQTTGGRLSRRTAVCVQRDYGRPVSLVDPSPETLDWATGANLVASPAFLNRAGAMEEDYFLYYEEVDWAFRRGDLPIVFTPQALVYHHGGATIGSGGVGRRPSAFSNYFNHRNRIRFARRFLSGVPVGAYAYGLAKAAQLLLLGRWAESHAVVCGLFELPPPAVITRRFHDPAVLQLAFGRAKRQAPRYGRANS
jgi:GT2 family glycosyltransferase